MSEEISNPTAPLLFPFFSPDSYSTHCRCRINGETQPFSIFAGVNGPNMDSEIHPRKTGSRPQTFLVRSSTIPFVLSTSWLIFRSLLVLVKEPFASMSELQYLISHYSQFTTYLAAVWTFDLSCNGVCINKLSRLLLVSESWFCQT